MITSPRRSGMARVLKGSHSFTCTPRVHPLTEWTIPALLIYYHKIFMFEVSEKWLIYDDETSPALLALLIRKQILVSTFDKSLRDNTCKICDRRAQWDVPNTVRLYWIWAEPATLRAMHVYRAVSVSRASDNSSWRPDINSRTLSLCMIASPSLSHVMSGSGIPCTGQRSTATLFLTTRTCFSSSVVSIYAGTVYTTADHL